MRRLLLSGLVICLAAAAAGPESGDRVLENKAPESRTVLGVANPLLAAGADAIRAGRYAEGIGLTERGLEQRGTTRRDRAAGLSNLCAAYAASEDPDIAIGHCTESLSLESSNWRAFSNRAYAYWLKGMYVEARFDIDAAAALNPTARQVLEIKARINEAVLRPRVSVEDHQ